MSPGGDIPDPVKEHAAIADWGIIWVIGGLTDANENNVDADLTIHKYSLEDDAWELLVPTSTNNPKRMNSHAAELINGYIYVSYQDQMWRFLLETNSWEKLADCPYYDTNKYNLQWHNTAAFNDKFYVLRGGMGMGSDIYEYDPDANSWSSIQTTTPLKTGSVNGGNAGPPPDLWGSSSWQEGSLVFFVGGRDASTSEITGDCWYFNFTNFSWEKSDVYEKRYHGAASQATSYEKREGVVWGGTDVDDDEQKPKKGKVILIPPVEGKKMLSMDMDPSPAGNSSVSPAPGKHEYPQGEEVPLTASPDTENGWNFTRWSGDKTGSENPSFIKMNTDKIVTAHFVQPVITFSTTGPERKVIEPNEVVEQPIVDIMQFTIAANEVDDWVLSQIKFNNLNHRSPISSVFLSIPDGTVTGEMNEEHSQMTFNFIPSLLIPKGTSINVTLNYNLVLAEGDQSCPMTASFDVMKFKAEISGAVDVSCIPVVYEYGKKLIPNLESKFTFIACIYNQANWGFLDLEEAVLFQEHEYHDVITILPGEYLPPSSPIQQSITIRSLEGPEKTIIKCSHDGYTSAFDIKFYDVGIRGLTIKGAYRGINITKVTDRLTIEENYFDNCKIGIFTSDETLHPACTFIIKDNKFRSTLKHQKNIEIRRLFDNCIVTGNSDIGTIGLFYFDGPGNIKFTNNTMNNFYFNAWFEGVDSEISGNTIKSCTILAYQKKKVFENIFGGSDQIGLYLKMCTDNQFYNNTFLNTHSHNSLYLDGSSRNTFIDNDIKDSKKYGIVLLASRKNEFINNRIGRHQYGIYVMSGLGNLFQNNKIFENEEFGILSFYGGNKILGNYFYRNGTDINVNAPLYKKKPNIIKGNKFVEPQHSQTSISVLNSSPVITQNSFIDAVGAAIILNGDIGPQSISQNNFSGNQTAIINNTPQLVYADLNYWDSETGPSDTDIVGQVSAVAWLETPVIVSTAFMADTLFVPTNTEDSTGLMIISLDNNPDSISVVFTDQLGWLTGSMITGAQVDTVGSLVYQAFQTPTTEGDGQGNYIFAQASSTSKESTAIDSVFIALYVQEMEDIQVLPDLATVKPGDTVYFAALALDQHANEMIIDPAWSANLGYVSEAGMFLYDGEGEVIITATDPISGKEGTTRIYVSAADQLLSDITVSPDTLNLVIGETAYIWPEGFNQFGYPMTFIPSWTAKGGEVSNGVYLAGSEGGEFMITVSGDEGAVSANVIVIIDTASGIA